MTWAQIGNFKGVVGNTGSTGTNGTPANVGPRWTSSAYLASNYYLCNSRHNYSGATPAANALCLVPWVVTSSVTVTNLFFYLNAAGEANSYLRFGIFADDGYGRPSTLVKDCGTISTGSGNAGTVTTGGTAGAYQTSTFSQALTPGMYWVGAAAQNCPTTQPSYYCTSTPEIWNTPFGTTIPGYAATAENWAISGVTGALATLSGITSSSLSNYGPKMGFKVSA